ncbi:MAG: hypothetical protein MJE68_33025 [Proteobacteria bacterium]|nr:hypothetical protein [Pseudomonadota bacterium]
MFFIDYSVVEYQFCKEVTDCKNGDEKDVKEGGREWVGVDGKREYKSRVE